MYGPSIDLRKMERGLLLIAGALIVISLGIGLLVGRWTTPGNPSLSTSDPSGLSSLPWNCLVATSESDVVTVDLLELSTLNLDTSAVLCVLPSR